MNPDVSKIFYGYIIVASASIILLVLWAVFYSFGVFLIPLIQEFGWSRASTAGAFSLCSIIMGFAGIAGGRVNDTYGPRVVMSISGLVLGFGYIMMGFVNSVWQLYLFYGIFVGVGMVGGFVPLMSTIARWFNKRRGLMTGVISAAIGIGAVTGPPLANKLIVGYGWRMSYFILGASLMILVVSSAQLLKRDPADIGKSADGSEQCVYGSCSSNREGLSQGEALRTLRFWIYFAMIICFGFCLFSIMVHIVAHAVGIGLSAGRAAKILAAIGVFSIAGKLLMGRLTDTFGSRTIFLVNFILMSAALIWLVLAKDPWALFLFAALFGVAYGGGVTSESPLVAALFGLRAHGYLLGLISFGFALGGAFGPWITGRIFDISDSYRTAFMICAIFSAAGTFLTALLHLEAIGGAHHLKADLGTHLK
ncbi:MAG: MFS transporter [Syntrophales bacterium]|nr:MFS transporter [Syntrophales bacterium]MDY0043821.1 MFS transporter [Syntrophales bacterium]